MKTVGPFKFKEYILCVISSLLLIVSFPNFNLWIFAWFGFVPLFFALENKSKAKAFLLAYLTGVIFWWGVIYWLIHVTLAGTIVLIFYLALYFGFFGLIVSVTSKRQSVIYPFFIASIWILFEYVRAYLFTGFPWSLLGHSQSWNLPIIQIADITGAWGVSFLVMLVNVAIKEIISRDKKPFKRIVYLICLLLLLTFFYGFFRLNQKTQGDKLRVAVIQGNIPQDLKWEPAAKTFIVNKYSQLSEEAATSKPDLIVWPEASSPDILGEDNQVFHRILALAQKIKTPLLVGTVVREDEKYFNSALLINSSGEISSRYDKVHLVPFGEYIPLKKYLPFLQVVVPIGDINRGTKYTVFALPPLGLKEETGNRQTKFSVLICFEDLFPELSRQFARNGAQFLVNITNDAWYKKTSAAEEHFQASVFRAVENRLVLLRAANTGISGFIAPDGRVISLLEDKTRNNIFIAGYKTEEIIIPSVKKLSFYSRHGDFYIFILFIFVIYCIFRLVLTKSF